MATIFWTNVWRLSKKIQKFSTGRQHALGNIQSILIQFGKSLADFQLPEMDEAVPQEEPNAEEMRDEAENIRPSLNQEQLQAVDSIMY